MDPEQARVAEELLLAMNDYTPAVRTLRPHGSQAVQNVLIL
jgi:hypothetical protein